MAVQLTLLDGDTGGKRSSLELLAGGVVGLENGLAPGTYDGEPLVWDLATAAWVPRSDVVVDLVAAQNAGVGPGTSSLLILRGHSVINREDNINLGFLNGSQTHICHTIVGGNTAQKFEADEATGVLKLRFFDNGTAGIQPTVTGSQGGNAALASLLTALASLGLIIDTTTP